VNSTIGPDISGAKTRPEGGLGGRDTDDHEVTLFGERLNTEGKKNLLHNRISQALDGGAYRQGGGKFPSAWFKNTRFAKTIFTLTGQSLSEVKRGRVSTEFN